MSATGVTMSAGYERPAEQAEPAHCQRTFGILGLVTLGIVLGGKGKDKTDITVRRWSTKTNSNV